MVQRGFYNDNSSKEPRSRSLEKNRLIANCVTSKGGGFRDYLQQNGNILDMSNLQGAPGKMVAMSILDSVVELAEEKKIQCDRDVAAWLAAVTLREQLQIHA
jgi:hypothetical protein